MPCGGTCGGDYPGGDEFGGAEMAFDYEDPPAVVTLQASTPAVSISEADQGQTVAAGSPASFDIHADAGASKPASLMVVSYSTMNQSGSTPATFTPKQGIVVFEPGDFSQDPNTHDYVANCYFAVQTNPASPDGASNQVAVQLSDPYSCTIAGSGQATATIQDPQLQMWLTDTQNPEPILISGAGGPVDVEVGELIRVMAYVNGSLAPAPAGVDWLFPGNNEAIEGFNPNAPNNQLTGLGVPGIGSEAGMNVVSNGGDVVPFEFVAGGANGGAQDVTLAVDGVSLTVPFNVQAPQVTVTASVPPNIQLPKDYTVVNRTIVQPVDKWLDWLWMWPLTWTPSATPDGWTYCFAQTATIDRTFTIPNGNGAGVAGNYHTKTPGPGLDAGFPYTGKEFPPLTPDLGDQPVQAVFSGGGDSYLCIKATTYYMCEPANGVGGWVPLAELTWSWTLKAMWPSGQDLSVTTSNLVVSGKSWPIGNSSFTATTDFPEWNTTLLNPAIMVGPGGVTWPR
jgi:hypothetical protein